MSRKRKSEASSLQSYEGRTVASLPRAGIPLLQGTYIKSGPPPTLPTYLGTTDREQIILHPLLAIVSEITKIKRGRGAGFRIRYQPLAPYYDWTEGRIIQLDDPERKRVCSFTLPCFFAESLIISPPPLSKDPLARFLHI